jgi:ATP-binding cassette subfamily B protein
VHGAAFLPVEPAFTPADHPIVLARDVRFRFRATGPAVIHVSGLRIHPGERLLLEGPSGGGKSTLGALLAGLRLPDSGVLLLYGVDHLTLGAEAWRRQVILAPQFHENYVLPETLAFNLLMGHRWPPRLEDLIEAAQVCRELGLGPLLERMPAGLFQMVGERGWQLSHGERSRMYIARALLQHGALLILDESFASLDPENLARAVQCVFNRAQTLVVIAHP